MMRINIMDIGAKPAGGLQTRAIQAAIDQCRRSGGGEVVVPRGTFQTGALVLRTGVRIRLEEGSVLLGSGICEDYQLSAAVLEDPAEPGKPLPETPMRDRWRRALINAYDASGIGISGPGTLDGADCFDALGEEHFRGPHLMYLSGCSDIRMEGYTVLRSANYAHFMEHCGDILIRNVIVLGGHDGIHLRYCADAAIEGCVLHSGDDCVAGVANKNVSVKDCELNTSCNGFRFGGQRLHVKGCRFFGPGEYEHRVSKRHNMLSAFIHFSAADPEAVPSEDWLIEDCTMEHMDYMLVYNYSENDIWQCGKPLHDVIMRGISATDICNPIKASGGADGGFSLTLERSEFSFAQGHEAQPVISICKFRQLTLKDFTVKNSFSAPIVEAAGNGRVELVNVTTPVKGDLVKAIGEKDWHVPWF